MKVATIIGARPQFIKAATISRAIANHNHRNTGENVVEEILVHTGQHYDDYMSSIFFRELEILKPKHNLGVGSGSHGAQTGRMLIKIDKVLASEAPDWVLVYGDTNSTLAGALAAAKLQIPIAHVEAGLRSFNRRMPEEINRILTDQISDLLLCPSQVAVDNLTAEGIKKKVVITGDVMADALHFASSKVEICSEILQKLGLQPQGYLLATIHRAENTDDKNRLNAILSAFSALNEPVIFPVHPRTRRILQKQRYNPPDNVKLIDPVGYFDIIALQKAAKLLLTDSGGMQKEAYWLKVPCVTLRNETEWIETVGGGWNILAGADCDQIIKAVRMLKTPTEHPPLYGNGNAATRCLDALLESHMARHKGKE